jgi:hypothetical protein
MSWLAAARPYHQKSPVKVIEVNVEEGVAVTEGSCRWVVPGLRAARLPIPAALREL